MDPETSGTAIEGQEVFLHQVPQCLDEVRTPNVLTPLYWIRCGTMQPTFSREYDNVIICPSCVESDLFEVVRLVVNGDIQWI